MSQEAMKSTVANAQLPAIQLLTIANVQEILQVSRLTLDRLIQRGALHSIRIGRSVRIEQSELLAFIDGGGERNIQGARP